MSKAVLFVTGLGEDLNRAENMKCLYDAYQGEKRFICLSDRWNYEGCINSGKYCLIIIDVFPEEHPLPTILIWHSIQGAKLIGLDEGRYYKPEQAEFIDWIITAGFGGSELMSRCTGVPIEKTLDFGMPRTDRYFNRKRKQKSAEIRKYLYAPTFRHFYETPLPCIDWKWLDEQLTDDEMLVVKSHPYGWSHDLSGYRHIIEVNRMETSVNCLFEANVVITDYSSIMFDAYLLKKPVVLFEKNPGYCKTRGMYLDYPSGYCSRYATNEQELLEHLRSSKRLRTAEKNCINYLADACDGHSCERVCEFIKEMLNNGT